MKKTIIDLFDKSTEQYPDNVFMFEKSGGEFRSTTYREARKTVLKIGAGLVSVGVKPKDTVSILSEGCNDWILSELAVLYAGAVSVPLSIKLEESNDLLFRLKHADVTIVMVSANQLSKIRRIKEQLPLLKQIIVFDNEGELEDREVRLSDIVIKGEKYLTGNEKEFIEIGLSVNNDDYATITYTSGTTSDPKGVILTHRNYTANVEQALSCISIPPTFRTLIILPLDHCFAHVVGFYIIIASGASLATVEVGRTPMETLKNIPLNIREIKPDFLLSVPALAKSFRKNIETSIKSQGKIVSRMFDLALNISYAYNKDGYSKGSGVSFLLKPVVKLFDKILFSKVREAFGGRLKFFIGGGALLDAELQRFFYAIGIPMFQGYGLSEATPVISTNTPDKHRFGSSGVLVAPIDIKITDEKGKELSVGEKGEIVVRGENVMAGYWKNEQATASTLIDGWLYTGDMGYLGADGLLYVLGRFKSLLISSDGEKYSPEGMEEAFVGQSPYIEQIILYNNQNRYTSALVVPNRDAVRSYLLKHIADRENHGIEAVKLINKEIEKYRKEGEFAEMFPERWLPSTFTLLEEPFTEQNGFVNSTMKVVRGKVEAHYKERIVQMYSAEGKNIFNERNTSMFA